MVAWFLAGALWAAAQDADKPIGAGEVIRMAKAGIGDDVILAKIDDVGAAKLSDEDVLALKNAGVSETVIRRLLSKSGMNVVFKNASHRAVKISIDEKERFVSFSMTHGTDVPPGGTVDLSAPAGAYRIAIEGRPTTEGVRVPAEGSCTLTVKGADTSYIDLQTVVAEDAEGQRVVLLHVQGKIPVSERRRPSVYGYRPSMPVRSFHGPELSLLPYVRDTVLIGAGVGAIIGHQSGHRTQGAIIGAAAGLLMDHFFWRGW
ncbi:MAG: glycine zipper family protein [Planctomycetes bacterium]|nr:glycine zipper family protein [Planctomycetota bacterium]